MEILKNEQGYTLIEMVIVIVLLGVIGVVVATPLVETGIVWQEISARKNGLQVARMSLDKMVRELRNTQRLATDTPNISANTTASCLSFTTGENQNFTFNLNGSVLEECTGCDCGAIVAPNNLALNVSGFTVTCYDASNLSIACNTVTNVRRVKLRLSITESGEVANLDSEVMLRNLRGV